MTNIELKRGYEVMPDNNVRFGIRVINNSESVILDVEVILDYSESLFVLEGSKVHKLGTIPPAVPRTAEFILKPRGCIHKEEIGAIVIYKDHQWKRHTLEMRAKEVHCVCPFLKEKTITRADFIALSNSGYLEEQGVNFEGITVNKVVEFLLHTYKNRLYNVDEFSIENVKILYLAGDALGEKAYYLLTAVIKEYDGVTQILLRAASDKSYGLNGFLNEIVDNQRHLVTSTSAREIGIIKKEHVINIIDSVVQRTTFTAGEGAASVNIEGSVVQRTEIKADEEKRRQEEERLRKQKEEQERLRQEEAEKRKREEQKAKREEERPKREKEEQERKRQEQGRLHGEKEAKKERARDKTEKRERGKQERLRKQTEEISRSMKFVLIPAGSFMMGPKGGILSILKGSDEKSVHKVKISNPFYLGTYPVTQAEWKAVMVSGHNYSKRKERRGHTWRTKKAGMDRNPSYFKGDNLPIESVSWDDVQEFIKKLNAKEGTDKYRLPSEAEWEYACRAGATTVYSFGDSKSKLGDYAWYADNSGDRTHRVGQKKPNSWGLYDMHGNVWEWVHDVWHESYKHAPTDGSTWGGGGASRIFRGGGWSSSARSCRSADRFRSDPGYRNRSLGFRLLKEE